MSEGNSKQNNALTAITRGGEVRKCKEKQEIEKADMNTVREGSAANTHPNERGDGNKHKHTDTVADQCKTKVKSKMRNQVTAVLVTLALLLLTSATFVAAICDSSCMACKTLGNGIDVCIGRTLA